MEAEGRWEVVCLQHEIVSPCATQILLADVVVLEDVLDVDELKTCVGTPCSATTQSSSSIRRPGEPRAVNNLAIQSLVSAFLDGKGIVDESSARSGVAEVTSD